MNVNVLFVRVVVRVVVCVVVCVVDVCRCRYIVLFVL